MMSAFTFALTDTRLLLLLVIRIISAATAAVAVVAVTVGVCRVSQQLPGCCRPEQPGQSRRR